jgi:hypothetical protein
MKKNVGKEVLSISTQQVDTEQRLWLLGRGRCCGACPHFLSLRGKHSLLEAEVLCAMHDDCVCPFGIYVEDLQTEDGIQKGMGKCPTFRSLVSSDFKGVHPMLLEKAMQIGMRLPAELLAA